MFKIPNPATAEESERFPFCIPGVKGAYWLPLLQNAPVASIVHFENERPMSALLAAAPDDQTRDVMSRLDAKQVEALAEAWAEASDVEPGESSASPLS